MSGNTSEWTVQTVRVHAVEKHPNADKLDLITIGLEHPWSYTVVDQRGLRRVGDLVTYVSVGSLVPLNDDRWAFLRSRAINKNQYRIRAMSLRGVKSQGIITDYVPGTELGDDVSGVLCIEKWLNPDEEVRLPTLTKRYGFFRRLLSKLFRSQAEKLGERIPEYSVLNLRKVDWVFTEGEEVIYTEKIHGTNVRFGKVNGKLVVGSHRRIVSDNRNWLDKLLRRGVTGTGYYGENLYVSAVAAHVHLDELEEGIIYYGEIFGLTQTGKKIQDLTYGMNGTALRIFPSCYNLKTREWQFADYRVAPFVPTITVSNADGKLGYSLDVVKTIAELDSVYGGIREGVVVHSATRPGVAAKYVSHRYMER